MSERALCTLAVMTTLTALYAVLGETRNQRVVEALVRHGILCDEVIDTRRAEGAVAQPWEGQRAVGHGSALGKRGAEGIPLKQQGAQVEVHRERGRRARRRSRPSARSRTRPADGCLADELGEPSGADPAEVLVDAQSLRQRLRALRSPCTGTAPVL
jgi:hypothetical protein